MKRLLISVAVTLACICSAAAAEKNMIGGPDPNNAAQGVGDTTETGTNPSGVDPVTGKPPSYLAPDNSRIFALSEGAKAGAKAGGVAGILINPTQWGGPEDGSGFPTEPAPRRLTPYGAPPEGFGGSPIGIGKRP